jgi:hypothetical protein
MIKSYPLAIMKIIITKKFLFKKISLQSNTVKNRKIKTYSIFRLNSNTKNRINPEFQFFIKIKLKNPKSHNHQNEAEATTNLRKSFTKRKTPAR